MLWGSVIRSWERVGNAGGHTRWPSAWCCRGGHVRQHGQRQTAEPGKGHMPCMTTSGTDLPGEGQLGVVRALLEWQKSLLPHHRTRPIIELCSSLNTEWEKDFCQQNSAVRGIKKRILGELPNCLQILSPILSLTRRTFVTSHSPRLHTGAGWFVVSGPSQAFPPLHL